MQIPILNLDDKTIHCSRCKACCCQLEVMLISDTGVPEQYIQHDLWGAETMKRLGDGYCAALDRETHLCLIYNNRPQICRDFVMNSQECRDERTNFDLLCKNTKK